MAHAPPTSPGPMPGPMPSPAPRRINPIVQGLLIHVGCVLAACVVVPLAMGSNIWPIAAVFWAVLSVPVACGTGALTGLLLRKTDSSTATWALIITGAAVAIAVGIIMFNNR